MSSVVLFRMQQSNCLVGVVEDKDADTWYLSAVAVVRRWGTTTGFPELCAGPTDDTVLDHAPMPPGALAEVNRASVHYALPAQEEVWLRVFEGGRQ